MIKQLAVAAALLVSSSWALADAFADLKTQLQAFNSYQATFEQKTFDEKGFPLQSLQGQLQLEKPAKFFWQSEEPFPQQLVCDGKTIWHFDEDLEQVVIQQYAEQAQQAPILVMLENVESLKKSFKITKVEDEKTRQRFHLQALNEKDALKTVQLGFENKQLVSLAFIDNLGQKTHIAFANVVLNQKADAGRFTFKIPDDADVLHQ